MFWLLLASFLLEFAIYIPFLWKFRAFLVPVILIIIGCVTGMCVVALSPFIAVGIGLVSIFRITNLLRIAKARMHSSYLLRATLRTSVSLFVLLVGWVIAVYIATYFISDSQVLGLLAGSQLLVAFGLLMSVSLNLRRATYKTPSKNFSDSELPTLSVMIPARNETLDLELCLKSLIASDYPKLEILVLDDCSHDKTADVIKSFAQDGVRFVEGEEPKKRWLAKNQAYQSLYQEASGEILLFCGVDTRFTPESLRTLVCYLLSHKLQMVSVLPRRMSSSPAAAFLQPMRYWWELAPPRWLSNRPAVLSTCWVIQKSSLKRLGSFAAISHAILPEAYFARFLDKSNDYRFVRASDRLNIQTVKSADEQRQTALRTQYPKIRRRLEIAMLLGIFDTVFLLGPFVLLITALLASSLSLALVSGISSLLLVSTHISILTYTDSANVPMGLINYPLVVIIEMYFGYASMFAYEFGMVEWKGRNVCIPVMHVIPRLPTIPDNVGQSPPS